MSRRSRRRQRKQVTTTKPQVARLSGPGATGLSLRSLIQRPRPMSLAARIARFAIAVPLMLIGAAGVFMVVTLPGTYGKSTLSMVGMNALTFVVSGAVAVFGAVLCVNAVRAPKRSDDRMNG